MIKLLLCYVADLLGTNRFHDWRYRGEHYRFCHRCLTRQKHAFNEAGERVWVTLP